jgi:hypothetical protein
VMRPTDGNPGRRLPPLMAPRIWYERPFNRPVPTRSVGGQYVSAIFTQLIPGAAAAPPWCGRRTQAPVSKKKG